MWLLASCAVFIKSVITIYWDVQWTCGFLPWKLMFKAVPWSTHRSPELSGFKIYDRIIMQVRNCPNWTLLDPLGPNWSTCFFFFASSPCIAAPTVSHIYLSTIHAEHLGSITFLDMLKLISASRKFTSCCSFLAWLRVIVPWFIFIDVLCSSTCVIVRSMGMSASSSLSWKRSHPRLWLLWAWSCWGSLLYSNIAMCLSL
jgi:hypothetical protein